MEKLPHLPPPKPHIFLARLRNKLNSFSLNPTNLSHFLENRKLLPSPNSHKTLNLEFSTSKLRRVRQKLDMELMLSTMKKQERRRRNQVLYRPIELKTMEMGESKERVKEVRFPSLGRV